MKLWSWKTVQYFMYLTFVTQSSAQISKDDLYVLGYNLGINKVLDFNGGISGGFFAGCQLAKKYYYGIEYFTSGSFDVSLFNSNSPQKELNDLNFIFGKRITTNYSYVNILSGIGISYGVERGKLISQTPNPNGWGSIYLYEEKDIFSPCIPIEISFGLSKYIGFGLKLKGIIGSKPYAGIYSEFSIGKLN